MHEMSIAEGILDIALETMKNNDASIVHSVQLDLGLMSGVEPDALFILLGCRYKEYAGRAFKNRYSYDSY